MFHKILPRRIVCQLLQAYIARDSETFPARVRWISETVQIKEVCQLWQAYITRDSETLPARVRWISETVQIKEGKKKRKKEKKRHALYSG